MKKHKSASPVTKYLFLVLVFSNLLLLSKAQDIVRNHAPAGTIVVPTAADSQVTAAAKYLQNIIQKSTGALLPITSNHSAGSNAIHLGHTSFVSSKNIDTSGLDEDGFILRRLDANNFVILGGASWGTEFGVYSFLERFMGVQYLMPTEIGMEVPARADLTLPDVNITDNPVYLSRQASPIDIDSRSSLGNWGRFNRLRGRIAFHHNMSNLFDPAEFGKTNRNFYSNADTIRDLKKNGRWQPNFSAPGIADTAVNKIVRYFKENPAVSSYSLGINDNRVFDESAASKSRRRGTVNYLGLDDVSDDYFQWANQVVQKVSQVYPNKKFGILAYNKLAEPPSKNIGVNKNIVPFLTYERLRWSDPALEAQGQQLTNRWAEYSPEVGWYDYTYGLSYLVPRVWFHKMQDYLIWGEQHHVKYYYAELYPNWGEGAKAWVQSKLLWNPHQNVDSLLNVWYEAAAGAKAAPSLKEFYSIWEKFWTGDIYAAKWDKGKAQYLPFNDLSYLDVVPQDYIDRSDKLINTALSLAGTDLQKQRVTKLIEMWNVYKMAVNLYHQSTTSFKKRVLSSTPEFANLLNSLKGSPLHSSSIQRMRFQLKVK